MARTEGIDSFPNTNWTFVQKAAEDAAPGRPVLGELLRRYGPVLRAHLVYKQRVPPDEAEDLIQDFIQRKILEGNLLRRADRNRGKLRTYLLTALTNFRIDGQRRKAATPAGELAANVPAEMGPDRDEVIWAMQVVIEGLRRMRAECKAKRRPDLWGIFAGRFLDPLGGANLVPYPALVEQFGLDSAHQASIRFTTAKAMFHRNLREILVEDGDEEVEDQVPELGRILCQASAELVEQLRISLWNDVPEVTLSTSGHSRIDPGALARLLDLPRTPADPAMLLQHVLTAPVPLDLGTVDASLAERTRAWAEGRGWC